MTGRISATDSIGVRGPERAPPAADANGLAIAIELKCLFLRIVIGVNARP
jgi:hypothetical protein